MLDDMLFERGHIFVRLGDLVDDYDCIIPEHYLYSVKNLAGDVVETNGSQYELISLDKDDNFEIKFIVDAVDFETDDGTSTGFNELVVHCTGTIIQEKIWDADIDVLKIENYSVKSVGGEY